MRANRDTLMSVHTLLVRSEPRPRLAAEPVVLVVEDHVDIAEMMAEILGAEGARVIVTSNVSQAEAALAEVRVDVVVTDYAMPGEDGLSLIRKLRASAFGGAHVPVVMVSAHDHDGAVAEEARALGARFLPKPVDLETLVDAVSAALAERAGDVGSDGGGRRPSAPPSGVVQIASVRVPPRSR